MATPTRTNAGTWTQRLFVRFFTVVLAVLVFWMLGFLMGDIGSWPGPDHAELERTMLDAVTVARGQDVASRIAETERRIIDERSRQAILRDGTQSSQETMRQLLEIQRLGLEKNVTPTAEEQRALAESESRFLSNQRRYQSLNEEIARLDESLRALQEERRQVEQGLESQRVGVRKEYEILRQRHELRVALVKLAALSPLLAAAAWLFLRRRASLYAPLIHAFGIAVLLKVGLVMHEHFPSRYFKYVLILACLAAVVRALVALLRTIAFPRPEWLLKQYREAYESFFCPVCDYPIRRGPLAYLSWTRRTIRRLVVPQASAAQPEGPYTCPTCGTRLFEECERCHTVRHSLLPACCGCGDVRPIAAPLPADAPDPGCIPGPRPSRG